jgi:hypothetical protein
MTSPANEMHVFLWQIGTVIPIQACCEHILLTKFVRFLRVHIKMHKLLQVCKQVVTNLFTSCRQVVFALLVPSCCNKFGQAVNYL